MTTKFVSIILQKVQPLNTERVEGMFFVNGSLICHYKLLEMI